MYTYFMTCQSKAYHKDLIVLPEVGFGIAGYYSGSLKEFNGVTADIGTSTQLSFSAGVMLNNSWGIFAGISRSTIRHNENQELTLPNGDYIRSKGISRLKYIDAPVFVRYVHGKTGRMGLDLRLGGKVVYLTNHVYESTYAEANNYVYEAPDEQREEYHHAVALAPFFYVGTYIPLGERSSITIGLESVYQATNSWDVPGAVGRYSQQLIKVGYAFTLNSSGNTETSK